MIREAFENLVLAVADFVDRVAATLVRWFTWWRP